MADLTRVVRGEEPKHARKNGPSLAPSRNRLFDSPPSGGKGVESFHFWIVTPPPHRLSDDHVATR